MNERRSFINQNVGNVKSCKVKLKSSMIRMLKMIRKDNFSDKFWLHFGKKEVLLSSLTDLDLQNC